MKGYKVFNSDWTCRDFKFEVGKTYEVDVVPKCCENGFHYCVKLVDCFSYYSFNHNNKVAEIKAIGDIDFDNNDKHCTNKIHIVKELTWNEALEMVNLGKGNTGNSNSGDNNSGNWNSGDRNSGCSNSGDNNSGDWNSGNRNSGNWNSGYKNSGHNNSGEWNSGDWNSGDWNKSNNNSGCFNIEQHKLMFFDKPTDMTYDEWYRSKARLLLNTAEFNPTVWVRSEDMTIEEKANHPSHETTGGYLKKLDNTDCCNVWWNSLNDHEKDIIKAIPNFDADKFYEITGVRV